MGQPSKEAKARYREKNRKKIREKSRIYSERKRREAGMPKLGTPESTANRRNARKLSGPEHGMWKGDDVGNNALHDWVKRYRAKIGVCSHCGKEAPTDWDNISTLYKRDLSDWRELCRSCHRRRHGRGLDQEERNAKGVK